MPLRQWSGWSSATEERLARSVRQAAYEVIKRKGATNHAIGLVTARLVECLLDDQHRILTVSRVQQGRCGIHDVALSLPALVGRDGATLVLEPAMEASEREALQASAKVLRAALDSLSIM